MRRARLDGRCAHVAAPRNRVLDVLSAHLRSSKINVFLRWVCEEVLISWQSLQSYGLLFQFVVFTLGVLGANVVCTESGRGGTRDTSLKQ
jgi:hypothetical protein